MGAAVYAGPVARVETYFSQLGYDTPHGDNPGMWEVLSGLILLVCVSVMAVVGCLGLLVCLLSSLGGKQNTTTADYFMRVLQLGPGDEDENGKKGSDLPALWLEKGQVGAWSDLLAEAGGKMGWMATDCLPAAPS